MHLNQILFSKPKINKGENSFIDVTLNPGMACCFIG